MTSRRSLFGGRVGPPALTATLIRLCILTRCTSVQSKVPQMAKRSKGPNKSKAIRDYYDSHPDAKPRDVVVALKKKGISVNAQFVSTIRSVSKKKGGKIGKPGRPVGSGKKNGEVSYASLIKVKQIVDEMGGIQHARSALTALERLVD